MPAFRGLQAGDLKALLAYVRSGADKTELEAPARDDRPPYRFTGYRKFLDPDGYPAVAPPWGTLNAIDLNTGQYLWKIPFGEYPELADKSTGSENYGGPILTARRRAVHRRHALRQEDARLRSQRPASCCGRPPCPTPAMPRRSPIWRAGGNMC